MPNYTLSPFKAMPQLLVPGTPSYVWGGFNDKTGPTLIQILFDKTNGTTTATIQFRILSGNVPVNGSLLTVVGCANSANFNVTNVAIANVTQLDTPDDGIYTCTYTISSTATPTQFTADFGQGIIPQPETSESITGTVASAPVSVGAAGPNSSGKSLSVSVVFPNSGNLSATTVTIQGANIDLDSQYVDIGTVTSTGATNTSFEWQSGQGTAGTLAGGSVNSINFKFYRLKAATTGTGPIIGKILL